MRKRRRGIFRLLIIPFVVLVWFIGWSLYWVGEAKEKLKPKLPNRVDKLTLAVLLPRLKLKLRNPNYAAEAPEKIKPDKLNVRAERVFES